MPSIDMQLGKNGITENFIETMKHHFLKHDNVRISVLKSAGHERNKVKEYSEEILNKLGLNYTAKIIGFKIAVKNWRRPVSRK